MGRFTVHADPAVDRAIDADLKLIAKSLVDAAADELLAILITGGFGRGEGSVILDPERGARPLNDYDMVLIARSLTKPTPRLQQAQKQLEQELGVMVDLGVFDRPHLHKHPRTLSMYEIREGHQRVWGTLDGVRFPQYDVSSIPATEATDLLFNRGMSLLRSQVARSEDWPQESRRQAAIHIQKAIQAWGDAALLNHGSYTHLYRERQQRITALSDEQLPPIENLAERYQEAIARKLEPRATDPDPVQARLLDKVIADHEAAFRWHEEMRLGREIGSWQDYATPGLRRTSGQRPLRDWLRNPLRNLRSYRAKVSWRGIFRSPRDRMVGVFPAVLFGSVAEGDQALRSIGIDDRGREARKEFLARWH